MWVSEPLSYVSFKPRWLHLSETALTCSHNCWPHTPSSGSRHWPFPPKALWTRPPLLFTSYLSVAGWDDRQASLSDKEVTWAFGARRSPIVPSNRHGTGIWVFTSSSASLKQGAKEKLGKPWILTSCPQWHVSSNEAASPPQTASPAGSQILELVGDTSHSNHHRAV